jgi:hypothetical protein
MNFNRYNLDEHQSPDSHGQEYYIQDVMNENITISFLD